MFLGNNFRGTNLTIPVHRGLISREEEKITQKSGKKWMLLPVLVLAAGLLAVIYFTPSEPEENNSSAPTQQTEVQS